MKILRKRDPEEPNKTKYNGIKLKWELLFVFMLFVFFAVMIVWILQVKYLNTFYRKARHAEVEKAASTLTDSISQDETILRENALRCASDYDICIRIFTTDDNDKLKEIASVEGTGACFIHYMGYTDIKKFFNKALENGGVYVETFELNTSDVILTPDIEHSKTPDINNTENPTVGNDDTLPKDEYIKDTTTKNIPDHADRQISNELYIKVFRDSNGYKYGIILNTDLMPMKSIVSTLSTQFIWILCFLVAGAVVMTFIILRTVAKPVSDMNEAAKKLSEGKYNVRFPEKGCTETRELAFTLNHAASELSKNDNLRKELIANISHDLRTPLTMICGYSEIMRDIPEENTPENMQVVIDEATRMSELVKDLMDISKLESGIRQPVITCFDLTETVREVLARYDKLIKHDGYSITFSADRNVFVNADRTMILQVIYNLINNAINYCGEDKIVRVTQTANLGLVRITVADKGEGIEPTQIPYIWDRYYKVDKVHKRDTVGTGLGLSIVKNILEQHDASYGVLSTLGAGSAFWFELKIISS